MYKKLTKKEIEKINEKYVLRRVIMDNIERGIPLINYADYLDMTEGTADKPATDHHNGVRHWE